MNGSEPLGFPEIVKLGAPILQLIVIVIGWFVFSKDNNRRERRKEIRALLNEIRAKISEIEALALSYYCSHPENSIPTGMKIKQELQRLGNLGTLCLRLNPAFSISTEIMHFRQKVTGGDFESVDRKKRTEDHELFIVITQAGIALTYALEDAFARAYK